jgi:hypothetical protein
MTPERSKELEFRALCIVDRWGALMPSMVAGLLMELAKELDWHDLYKTLGGK